MTKQIWTKNGEKCLNVPQCGQKTARFVRVS